MATRTERERGTEDRRDTERQTETERQTKKENRKRERERETERGKRSREKRDGGRERDTHTHTHTLTRKAVSIQAGWQTDRQIRQAGAREVLDSQLREQCSANRTAVLPQPVYCHTTCLRHAKKH